MKRSPARSMPSSSNALHKGSEMPSRSRLNKGELLKRHLQEKAVSILGHDHFEITLHRGFCWLITLLLHPKSNLSRRKRARLRNELFATLGDVKETMGLAVDVHISIEYEQRIIPIGTAWADVTYVFVAQRLLDDLKVLVEVIREQTDHVRTHVLCRFALLQSYETTKHMWISLRNVRDRLHREHRYLKSPALQRVIGDFPQETSRLLQKLENELRPLRNKYAAHRLFEDEAGKSPLLLGDELNAVVLLSPTTVEGWYDILVTASQEIAKFIKKNQFTDFSVVVFRLHFMLVSEEHLMKPHKNQGLLNLLSPLISLGEPRTRVHTMVSGVQASSQ
jgi:hypothetical protein